jgi:hypothetical protein
MTLEKVSGLEELAEVALPTPMHRAFLNAELLENPDAAKTVLAKFLEGNPGKELIARSAHPMEDAFSGGAMESFGLDLKEVGAQILYEQIM